MTIDDYLNILDHLGVDTHDLKPGKVLRMRDGRRAPGMYFNCKKSIGIYFTLYLPGPFANESLWDYLPDEQIGKRRDKGKPNVVPKPGMERRALRQLLESAGVL